MYMLKKWKRKSQSRSSQANNVVNGSNKLIVNLNIINENHKITVKEKNRSINKIHDTENFVDMAEQRGKINPFYVPFK